MIPITNFSLNGELYYSQKDLTLFDIITYFNYNDSLLVLEYNNLLLDKRKWEKIIIKDKDKIEIVTIVGGG
jgi:thiamine biosynthesis protein ThiS